MLCIGLLLFFVTSIQSLSYLDNNHSSFEWIDFPTESILNERIGPYNGMGCSISANTNDLYFVTSMNPGNCRTNNNAYCCSISNKFVEVLKYDLYTNNFTNSLLIGDATTKYPNAYGGTGSNNVVTCGIFSDSQSNILYFITENAKKCEPYYNYDSSIIRINLDTFQFLDRTLLKNIPGVPTFSTSSYYNYLYMNNPTTVELIDNYLWIGFGTYKTGIWKIKINESEIVLDFAFQKTYKKTNDMQGGSSYSYDATFNEIKNSFVNKKDTLIYFLEDSGYSDSQLLIINYSKPVNENNSYIQILDGINYVSNIKFDSQSGRIYIVSGSLSSEMYQYDLNFNKLRLSEGCSTDFLKFPTEWGVITNIEIDSQTGFVYAPLSTKYDTSGMASINQKDSSINLNSLASFKELIISNKYSYYQFNNNMNITSLLLHKGILVISSNHYSYNRKIAFVYLNGCALGRGIEDNKCVLCGYGKFSDRIGGICEECEPGFASNVEESFKCTECTPGQFSDGRNAIHCNDCPNGFFTDKIGDNTCQNCKAGTYSITSGSESVKNCLECDPGKISYRGSIICSLCPAGKWSKRQKNCLDCPKGRYSFSLGLESESSCLPCPAGTFSDENGLVFENQCKQCVDGYIGLTTGATSNSSCMPCEQGKFRENIITCESCDNGHVAKQGQVECNVCPVGKVSDTYKITCLDCPIGKFSDSEGMHTLSMCSDCEPGRYNNKTGMSSFESCIECHSGKYNINPGMSSETDCILCDPGKYRQIGMDIVCDICEAGKYSARGETQCKFCTPGQYANAINDLSASCEECPAGKFFPENGGYLIESCIDCPNGKWSNIRGIDTELKCFDCKKGQYGEIMGAISRDACINCEGGKFNYNTASSSINECKPCATGSVSSVGASECSSCEIGRYSEIMGETECKLCPIGQIAPKESSYACALCPDNSEENIEKTICSCKHGMYNNGDVNTIECIECPDKFICEKGSTIQNMVIKEHYWRSSNQTLEVYKCKHLFACKGGKLSNGTNDLCHPGHKGPVCDVCEKGWSKDDGVCLKCPENIGRTVSLTILIPIICILIIIFLIKTANPSNNKKEEVNGVVKIFMNYAQVFSLASSFQINWPSLIKYLFERAKEFSSPRVSFYSSDCALGWVYYDKFIVYLALPIVYILMSTIIIFIVSLCYCKKKKSKLQRLHQSQRQIYIDNTPTCIEFFTAWEKTAVVVGTFLSWPTIVEKTLEIMNCEKIGGEYYLVKDVSVVCYNRQHYTFLSIGYAGLILYGVGIPLLGFRLLYKYRFRLYDMQNRYDGSTPLSFLFLGYRENRWYYEFIIMGKKAGLILLSVFLRNHPRYQIIGASLLIQISFFIHVFLRPYDTITSYGMICNKLESVSLLSLVMTLSTGLFFGTIDSGYNLGFFEDVLIMILLVSNGVICMYFFVYFVTLTYKSIKTHVREHVVKSFADDNIPCLFRCCSIENITRIRDWGDLEMVDDYGIHLQNQVEKEIFTKYYKEKQSKLAILNGKIDKIKERKVSVKLDRLRSQIQVMEKERCWQTIQNNRLYTDLKKTVMTNKKNLNEEELKKVKEVFNLYVNHGITYNKTINELCMGELRGMIHEDVIEDVVENVSRENIIVSFSEENGGHSMII